MRERQYPVPCILAPKSQCQRVCLLFSMSASIFADAMDRFETTPELEQSRLTLESHLEANEVYRAQIRAVLKFRGELYDCKYFMSGC